MYHDATGRFSCPLCGHNKRHTYNEIPRHRRVYEEIQDGQPTDVIEYMPEIRDYKCGDCEFEWALDPEPAFD